MRQTAKDVLKMRDVFKDAASYAASVEVEGDALDIKIMPEQDTMVIMAPFNEEGEMISIIVTPAILKRWHRESQEGRSLMRRMLSGEGRTDYQDLANYGRRQQRNSRR